MTEKAMQALKCMLSMQRYSWEQGVCAQALYEAGREDLWIPMAYDAIKRQSSDGRLAMIGSDAAVSDPASNGEVCLRAFEKTGDPFYLNGAQRMLQYLLEAAPRTRDGIICHNAVSFENGFSPHQLWVDGLYMVPPFLAVMGKVSEAVEQIRGYIRHLFDRDTGLFFHIIDTAEDRFVRQKHWATGNGWALMGIARVIEAADRNGFTAIRDELSAFLDQLLESMLKYQLPDGRFHDILDDPKSFVDGTSAMMMAATVFRGIRKGYVMGSFRDAAETAFLTVADKTDQYGLVHEVCGCPDFISQGTSAEAQAAFIMADAWREKLSGNAGEDQGKTKYTDRNEESTMSGKQKTIYLAGGCFWGCQKFFDQFDGVTETEVGYANGPDRPVTYEEVCRNSGHAETVRVAYDEEKMPLKRLLEYYFMVIDPLSVNRQGHDTGIQYRTGIYYTDESQLSDIMAVYQAEEEKAGAKLAVEVKPLANFFPAEEYHQDYLEKNPGGYCHIPDRYYSLG